MIDRLVIGALVFFVNARCDILEGPGDNARIIPNSEDIPAEDLPLEHRGESVMILPDVFSISRNVTSQLHVDLFFSLFFVFLNNQFDATRAQFTIFAPAYLPTKEATRWLSAEEKLTEELLLNHIVMGEHLRPEIVTLTGVVRSTLGGLEVAFSIDDDGELWVNDVKIVAWRTEGQALIIALDDYLFKQEVNEEVKNLETVDSNELSRNDDIDEDVEEWGEDRGNLAIDTVTVNDSEENEEFPNATPRNQKKKCTQVENKSGLSIFKTITVCTENVSSVKDANNEDKSPTLRKIDSDLPLLEDLQSQLGYFRGGPGLNYFLTYANSTGLESELNSKKSYTLLAPTDQAFQSWHPIDWGFNPFLVEEFLEDLMKNLVVEEFIAIEENNEKLTMYKTLSGKLIEISTRGENIYVNNILILGDLPLAGGNSEVIFLDKVPWLDNEIVQELRQNFSHLETGPPVFNGSIESLNNGSTVLLQEFDYDITTNSNSLELFGDNFENKTNDVTRQDNEEFAVMVDDFVNFPQTTTSEQTDYEEIAPVNFPSNITAIKILPQTESLEDDNIKFYNRSVDNNASMVVFRLKQLLQSEEINEEDQEKASNDGDYNGQPKQRRIVYINNQRVELESEV